MSYPELVSNFQTEQRPDSIEPPSYTETETLTLYERIRQGNASVEELQNLLDREPKLEGFLNAAAFERRLGNLLQRGVRGVLVAADIDSLKHFNDTQGHPAGDQLIRIAARLLRSQTRTNSPTKEQSERRRRLTTEPDLLGLVGGDELVLFFVEAEMPEAIEASKRVRTSIVTAVREAFPSYEPDQTVSIGLSAVRPNDSVLSIRERADTALYKAKGGKNSKDVVDSIAIN